MASFPWKRLPKALPLRSDLTILILHNSYQLSGGEDRVFDAESRLLSSYGHKVLRFEISNELIKGMSPVALAKATFWNRTTYFRLQALLEKERPHIAHFHNTFPLISPSAYYACSEAGVPVVQTLHNFRILCPGGILYQGGKVCEACVGERFPWRSFVRACYRKSFVASFGLCAMLSVHTALHTWTTKVDIYIALTQFARKKFVQGGIPGRKIVVKPNFVEKSPSLFSKRTDSVLFVGRFSPEKGVRTMLKAWFHLRGIPLRMVGDGPLKDELMGVVQEKGLKKVEIIPWISREEVLGMMATSRLLVFPSVCYEGFPMSLSEAFACGLPVIASRLGAMAEIVEDGRTGLHFIPGDPEDLAAKVEWAWEHPKEMSEMGRAARGEYEAKYTPERNYQMLMKIYGEAAAWSKS
jgi:glycosyltransferase involved in cell wall biosynthesis